MMQIPPHTLEAVVLDDDAFDAATEAAAQAHVAYDDPHTELEHGLKAYVAAVVAKGQDFNIPGPPAPVYNPSEGWIENYAEWHERFGHRWCEAAI